MSLSIRLSATARAHRQAIWLYIAQNDLNAADRIVDRFRDILVLLADNPLAGQSKPLLGDGVRTYVVEGHVLCYRATESTIEVVAIFHGARNITRQLLED